MLKPLVVIFILFLIACSTAKKTAKPMAVEISLSDSLAGKELIAQNDCFTCHKFEEKLIGPSFSNVAKKYDLTIENINWVIKKIQTGGSGKWGKLPMTPHSKLSQEDAEKIVHYIFSLKK